MNTTLLIMAAGMGSRFGGLKQIEPVGPSGEFLIDYSIYDAINAGFNKVVIIIKKENLEVFRNTISKRFENKIKVEYAFQDLEAAKEKYNLPKERVKPLGTTHAILAAKDLINEPFVVINADDYYGKEAYIDAIKFLKENNYQKNAAILYKIENTLCENGAVKRGICKVFNNKLIDAIECNVIKEDKIMATPLNNAESFEVGENAATSMNMFVLQPEIFPLLEESLNNYILENQEKLDKCEALIIEDLFKLILDKKIEIDVVSTSSIWYGMTYKEDKQKVVQTLKELVENKEYPKNLWQ